MPPLRRSAFAAPDAVSAQSPFDVPMAFSPQTSRTPYQISPGGGFGVPPTSQEMEPGRIAGYSSIGAKDPPVDPTAPDTGDVGPGAGANTGVGPSKEQVSAAYQQYLGRSMSDVEYQFWAGNPNYATEISQSPEAKAHARGQSYTRSYTPVQGADTHKLNDMGQQSPKYRILRAMQVFGATRGNMQGAVDYYNQLYGKHAKVLSDDRVDMGEAGWGPIDFFNAKGDAPQFTMVGGGIPGTGSIPGASTSGAPGDLGQYPGGEPGGIRGPRLGVSGFDTLWGLGGAMDIPNMADPNADPNTDIVDRSGSTPAPYNPDNPYHLNDPPVNPAAPDGTPGPADPFGGMDYGVGNDPLSNSIDDALKRLLDSGGVTDYGRFVQDALAKIINEGGLKTDVTQGLIGARESAGNAQQAMLRDARAGLADSGLVNEPGIAQGAETGALTGIAERIAPSYAQAVRDVYTHATDVANASVLSSLQMATGLSENEANNILNTIGAGTTRQTALANIALGVLDRNIEWNKFLAQYGLDQAKLANDIQNGNMAQVIELLKLFLGGAGTAAGGYY